MLQNPIRFIVGLGNPGETYSTTRHNIGFVVVDAIAAQFGIPVAKKKFDTLFGRGEVNGNDVLLAKPMAYMNRSGGPIRRLTDYFGISSEEMLVVHDDIDLTFERLKIKKKGGHGGHNGIRSMIDAFGCGDFARLRIGIGRPGNQKAVVDHVLGKFSNQEKEDLTQLVTRARDAAVTILCDGIQEGMNRFN